MTTLVLCVDRDGDFNPETPVVGEGAIIDLITSAGIADPEDSRINCLLETLRVARGVREDSVEAVAVVVSGTGDAVSVDREIARQVDALVAEHDPQSAVVVVDSAADEMAVPIIESRLRVDAVDRVIVQQARDIESTYYLIKRLLVDEELRRTLFIPLGGILLSVPVIVSLTHNVAAVVAVVTAGIGGFLLYKGLGIDDIIDQLPNIVRAAFYAGQLSFVTYVVGVGLLVIGVFAGAISVSEMTPGVSMAVRFVFESVPWLALSGLVASIGRLFDELLHHDRIPTALLNAPFGIVALGLVIRGFGAFFLEKAGVIERFEIQPVSVGPVSTGGLALLAGTRLLVFVIAGVLISLLGVVVTSRMQLSAGEETDAPNQGD